MLASEVIKNVKFEDPITHDLVCQAMVSAYGLEYYAKEGNRVPARMFARALCDARHDELSWYEIAVRVQKSDLCHSGLCGFISNFVEISLNCGHSLIHFCDKFFHDCL